MMKPDDDAWRSPQYLDALNRKGLALMYAVADSQWVLTEKLMFLRLLIDNSKSVRGQCWEALVRADEILKRPAEIR